MARLAGTKPVPSMCFNMVTRNSESNRNLFLYGLMTFRFEISHVRTLTGQYHVTLMLLHVTILKHAISTDKLLILGTGHDSCLANVLQYSDRLSDLPITPLFDQYL